MDTTDFNFKIQNLLERAHTYNELSKFPSLSIHENAINDLTIKLINELKEHYSTIIKKDLFLTPAVSGSQKKHLDNIQLVARKILDSSIAKAIELKSALDLFSAAESESDGELPTEIKNLLNAFFLDQTKMNKALSDLTKTPWEDSGLKTRLIEINKRDRKKINDNTLLSREFVSSKNDAFSVSFAHTYRRMKYFELLLQVCKTHSDEIKSHKVNTSFKANENYESPTNIVPYVPHQHAHISLIPQVELLTSTQHRAHENLKLIIDPNIVIQTDKINNLKKSDIIEQPYSPNPVFLNFLLVDSDPIMKIYDNYFNGEPEIDLSTQLLSVPLSHILNATDYAPWYLNAVDDFAELDCREKAAKLIMKVVKNEKGFRVLEASEEMNKSLEASMKRLLHLLTNEISQEKPESYKKLLQEKQKSTLNRPNNYKEIVDTINAAIEALKVWRKSGPLVA